MEIEDRSSVAFGVAFILSNLTVTNRELRALALADKDISVDQYEKMMELQRIKAKDENGDEIEEKKVIVFYFYFNMRNYVFVVCSKMISMEMTKLNANHAFAKSFITGELGFS